MPLTLEQNIQVFTSFLQTVGFPIVVVVFVALVYTGLVPSPVSNIDRQMADLRARNEILHTDIQNAVKLHYEQMVAHGHQTQEAVRIARETCLGVRVLAKLPLRNCYEDMDE